MRIDRFFWLLAASLILLACGKEMPLKISFRYTLGPRESAVLISK